jgi:dTDP-4-amino-4,6-dideoxygalactose transaminase
MASRLAIDGGRPTHSRDWPAWPLIDDRLRQRLLGVLESGDWSLTGHSGSTIPESKVFESAFANFYGTNHCVATSSGFSALLTALRVLGLRSLDEVLIPANTWVAVPQAVRLWGATPVLVDVDPSLQSMDLEAARRSIGVRTRGIILVHQNGAVADAHGFRDLADRSGLFLIEDCSHAHGALVGGGRVGRHGHMAVFSMQQTKLLTGGEGGAILTDADDLAAKAERLAASGRLHRYDVGELSVDENADLVGGNFVMTEFVAALLDEALRDLDQLNAIRNERAGQLNRALREIGQVEGVVATTESSERVFHKFVIMLSRDLIATRSADWFCRALTQELGVEFSRLHRPLWDNPLLPGTTDAVDSDCSFPVAADMYARCIAFRHRYLLASPKDVASLAWGIGKAVEVAS